MKKNFIVCKMAFAVFTTGILISCSRQDGLIEDQKTASSAVVDSKPFSLQIQTGSVIGKINPAGKRNLWIYNSAGRVLGPYATEFGTGNFRINELPAGLYKLVIEFPGTTAVSSTDIQIATKTVEVEVKSGLVTDLGAINL